MKRKLMILMAGLLAVSFVLLHQPQSFADDQTEELMRKIDILQKRVEELESSQKQKYGNNFSRALPQRQAYQWDPFYEMDRMQAQMNRMMQSAFSHRGWGNGGIFSNSLNFENEFGIKDTKDGYEIRFDMAGMDNENVDIQIDEQSITVKGEYSRENTDEGPNRYMSSSSYGSFMKTIPVPVDADTAKMKTEKEGDSLVITMPKKSS